MNIFGPNLFGTNKSEEPTFVSRRMRRRRRRGRRPSQWAPWRGSPLWGDPETWWWLTRRATRWSPQPSQLDHCSLRSPRRWEQITRIELIQTRDWNFECTFQYGEGKARTVRTAKASTDVMSGTMVLKVSTQLSRDRNSFIQFSLQHYLSNSQILWLISFSTRWNQTGVPMSRRSSSRSQSRWDSKVHLTSFATYIIQVDVLGSISDQKKRSDTYLKNSVNKMRPIAAQKILKTARCVFSWSLINLLLVLPISLGLKNSSFHY